MTQGIGTKLIAAYLGVPEWRVKQYIYANNIQPVDVQWKANMYNPRPIITGMRHEQSEVVGKTS